ncbi:hypothetical protein BATDEDRAFT_89273 [Batrachochytrium dendrobatidis JAM81]|uniref:HIG1 domain-containing protein n=1 Tax=Batrachochytrium dendrobatidis (strain JAM81 / FGSC 10211) TaxID=684364 RepID=F4P445_BATDJ|nr:uncharacterized protein BATDEDRAFT_89273 [Batrachochytrium dendrobatidis JAM81]EGF79975.1 hypothetical protein BATDEDRAFT_89273 [Batrachochytrium dendrobatidis JAM81]KAJ8323196.1 HIG1 domain member 2A [Batrachochytrium dendrobatidis]KAK5672909.1 HIG1 domain member 2A [Batrachochytrium dendrobatidis]|eukprot:XP_006679742.1 hypothetical protein BATDEDRAFT_89273 [Batrachochytrium dendrobatidis JAM81]
MSDETLWQRAKRKFGENPFILPAVGLTVFALYRMFDSMHRRDVIAFQKAQRFRIGAQGLAMFVLVSGIWYQDYKFKLRTAVSLPEPETESISTAQQ